MRAVEVLGEYKKKIDRELAGFLDEQIKKTERDSELKDIMFNIKEFCLRGGKKIRPAFFIFGHKCFNGDNEKEIIKASMSVELMQAFLLMHDDIMDRSNLRRGKPTFHKNYEGFCRKKYSTDARRFGENMAIIGGDIIFALGSNILATSNFPEGRKRRAMEKFNQVCLDTSLGQVADLLALAKDPEQITEKEIIKEHIMKTAKYTVEGPLHMGAILAGAGERDLDVLSRYALPLGRAFQIQDDILGLFGAERETGKPVDSDLKEGKKTLLILKALEESDQIQKNIILSALGNGNLSRDDLIEVQNIVKNTGSLDYSRNMARKLIGQAKKEIEKSDFRKEAKDFLTGITDFVLERKH